MDTNTNCNNCHLLETSDRLANLTLQPHYPTTTTSSSSSSVKRRPSFSYEQPNPKKQLRHPTTSQLVTSQETRVTSPSFKKLKIITQHIKNLVQRWNNILQEQEEEIQVNLGRSSLSLSPSSKKLMMITYQVKKLIRLWEQILLEEEEENEDRKENEGVKENEGGKESKEAVSVEKSKDGSLMIRFNCPCKNAYQLIFSGSNCYYKTFSS